MIIYTNSLTQENSFMAPHRKIILPVAAVDTEVPPPRPPPKTPLIPPSFPRSEKGSHVQNHHPPLLAPPKRGTSCFCKCICWALSLVFLLLIVLGATLGALYLIFKPKLPNYSVESLRINDLRLNLDMTLYAKFDVKIIANNPNKKIGIYYEKGGRLSVWFTKSQLCEGSLPIFYQGHQNRTVLDMSLSGQAESGSTLMSALQEQQQRGIVPLELIVHAPVAIKLGSLKLRKVRILGKCMLVVDSLSANSLISIKASNCKFGLKL
ncbi:NDR1/HIN1-like protein 6 [Prosopis cineraria]|uniref:NDR1/HIN1-like protein 6 n=1 Tax=Prosopis cineraria TaxID=364024 RepID=UPI00240F2779|nr:NDR1/HIN1-like protein 6 [Prosopis cineraria]